MAELWPEGSRIGLAVSGGADSLAMLLLAHAAMDGRFEVATVNHGLRAEAVDECDMVARLCAERGIPCAILPVAIDPTINVLAGARAARYATLAQWAQQRGLAAIATAHHADDQAETFLMRLSHTSGIAGLAGIRRRGVVPGSDLPLLRPLLGMRRTDCEAVVAQAGLTAAHDPSNDDVSYTRVRIRQALRQIDLIDPADIATAVAHLADAEDALAWASEREWTEQVTQDAGQLRYRRQAPRAVAMRVVERAVGQIGTAPRGLGVARVIDRLERGENANIAGVMIRIDQGDWVFSAEPARRPTQ